jgi:SAM-dependent methyltransferase
MAIGEVPVFCNVLWGSREKALKSARGEIRLHFCVDCGHVFNAKFDPRLVQYDTLYENSLEYSPLFRNYLDELAERLVQRYHLHQKDIVEIGCGQGGFLKRLAERGGNRCTGFDPSFDERKKVRSRADADYDIVRDYYSEKYAAYPADFIASRQVLEHIVTPRKFMTSIRRSIGGKTGTVVFIEVPNALFSIEKHGIWDLIYEHCGYYTSPSLGRLFTETGFKPLRIEESFGGQYLCIEAETASGSTSVTRERFSPSIEYLTDCINGFSDNYRQTVSYWRDELQRMQLKGIRPVVWGAGSKGVTFLNLMPGGGIIDYVVDINPHKKGLYIAGTGQRVVSPEELVNIRPQVVITMNPLYTDEIKSMINERHRNGEGKPVVIAVDGKKSTDAAFPF